MECRRCRPPSISLSRSGGVSAQLSTRQHGPDDNKRSDKRPAGSWGSSGRGYPFYTARLAGAPGTGRLGPIHGASRIIYKDRRGRLTLACDDFQPLGAYLPSLFSGSMNKYSPSAREQQSKALECISADVNRERPLGSLGPPFDPDSAEAARDLHPGESVIAIIIIVGWRPSGRSRPPVECALYYTAKRRTAIGAR